MWADGGVRLLGSRTSQLADWSCCAPWTRRKLAEDGLVSLFNDAFFNSMGGEA